MTTRLMWRLCYLHVTVAFFTCIVSAQSVPPRETTLSHATAFVVSPSLRELANLPQSSYSINPPISPNHVFQKPYSSSVLAGDQVGQNIVPPGPNYTVVLNVAGLGTGFPGPGGFVDMFAPPDMNMAVGDTQIVQWVNRSLAVFDRLTGVPLAHAIDGNQVWAALGRGTLCADNNSGTPIAQWDRVAHRWLLTQNVLVYPYAVCVAVSQTPDALGPYNLYQFSVPDKGYPDYTKWGVWSTGGQSNGYYQTWNDFGSQGATFLGPMILGYNRAKMLAGDPFAEQIACPLYPSTEDSLLPADVDSPTSPPLNQDEFFIGSLGNIDNSHLSVFSMRIDDWPTGKATCSKPATIGIPTYLPACNGNYGGACVPQPGTTDKLDSLGDRLMYRFVYWSDPPATVAPLQHWLVNHDVSDSFGANAVRWYDFVTPFTPSPAPTDLCSLPPGQTGIYAPDSTWRWMGSIARDQFANILLGFSKSSSSIYPGIVVAGRQVNDPVGQGNLEAELSVMAGTGSQLQTSNRWGSYSAMRLDPNDNETFWYTSEYYTQTKALDWSTRIASIKFTPNTNTPATLIVGNAVNQVVTYDFKTGTQIASFVPDGITSSNQGRGLEVVGGTVYYTWVNPGTPSDGIHLAPFNGGKGGHDFAVFPNPNPGVNIVALDYVNCTLYAMTGYDSATPVIYALSPFDGHVINFTVINTSSGHPGLIADGFTVLPNGDFLINDNDAVPTYRGYNSTTGNPTGLVITPSNHGSGVRFNRADNSLYFSSPGSAGGTSQVVRTTTTGTPLGSVSIKLDLEDISVY